jgi:hypothetical protein
MSSTARYVSGDCQPTAVKCDPNYPIEVGDLLFLVPSGETGAGLARPASAMVNQTTVLWNQGAFHDVFLGVALQKNGAQANETLPLNSTINHSPANTIECATAGRFLYPCPATAFVPGQLVGVNATTAGCPNQSVASVANSSLAIGRAAPAADEIGVSLTQVIVQIESTVFGGGAQTPVAGSSSGAV